MVCPDLPAFNAALQIDYEEGLRLVRGYLRSAAPAELPSLLTQCQELGEPIAEEALYRVYHDPMAKPAPALIATLLGTFGYPAQLIGFEMGPVEGKRRHLLFLDTEDRFSSFKAELAAFDAAAL